MAELSYLSIFAKRATFGLCFPLSTTEAQKSSGAVSSVDYQKLTSVESDFGHRPGDGRYSWLGVLLVLAVWVILLWGGWRMYLCTLACFALFMAFLNRRELPGRISAAVRKWRATQKSRVQL